MTRLGAIVIIVVAVLVVGFVLLLKFRQDTIESRQLREKPVPDRTGAADVFEREPRRVSAHPVVVS
jgi:hypothetical protein